MGINRSAHLRAFPECDPVFKDIFGLRGDPESFHSTLKTHPWGQHARSSNLERNDLDLTVWALTYSIRACIAHRQHLEREARTTLPPANTRALIAHRKRLQRSVAQFPPAQAG